MGMRRKPVNLRVLNHLNPDFFSRAIMGNEKSAAKAKSEMRAAIARLSKAGNRDADALKRLYRRMRL